MEFIAPFPWMGRHATTENVVQVAKAAEEMGYAEISIGEHFMYPKRPRAKYPYLPGGVLPIDPTQVNLDIFTTLAFVAAHTKRLRLRSGLIVLPYYNPFIVAKQAATVDRLSNGRLILGIGVGWMEDEFAFLKAPFKERGAYTDEGIALINALWRGDEQFTGKYYSYKEAYFPGKTTQRYPPIHIGGASEAAMRRVARYGDGWHIIGANAEQTLEWRQVLRRYLAKEGRKEREITLVGGSAAVTFDGGRPDAKDALKQVEAWAKAGVSTCGVNVGGFTIGVDETLKRMAWFAEKVMPKAKG
ncbi:MAG: LLM class F420-dependent oxidoreductase [Chloroflexi bacterium]|nr:LLM class F420-dependent oxidoreductase [Chloroflexota bacterium]